MYVSDPTTTPAPTADSARRSNPERVAWRVLIASFTVFVLLCGATIYLIQWYLFESDVRLDVELTAARGTVRMLEPSAEQEAAVADRRTDQRFPFEVRTDTSQAILHITTHAGELPVASVVALHDTALTLLDANGPRFGFNNDPYTVQLSMAAGRTELRLLDVGSHETDVTLSTPHADVRITQPGHYLVDTTEDRTRVTVRRGTAYVTAPTSNALVEVPANHSTTVDHTSELPGIVPAEERLVANGDFLLPFAGSWTFYDDSVLPSGAALNRVFAGQESLTLDRSQEHSPGLTLDHGETGLRQDVDRDVRGYSYLELWGTFYVEEQSLSTCGQEGSECPMMIRMRYIDVQGIEREYIQGFYAYHDPALEYPLTCDSCRGEHERITLQSWYTFRSGNLFTVLPPEQQPAIIQQVRFYASGHAYRVNVSEMELLASR